MHMLKLIPRSDDFLNVSIPCLFEFSNVLDQNNKNEIDSTFQLLFNMRTNTYGINLRFNNDLLFTGQKIKNINNKYDLVLGIDNVDFPYISDDLEYPEEEILGNVVNINEIDRNIKYKYLNQGFFDYGDAVKEGNNLLKSYGLRSGPYYDFHGHYQYCLENDIITYVVAIPNNRELNPCVIQTFHSSNEKEHEEEITKYLSNISLLNKDYYNFYMHQEIIKNPNMYFFGFFNLSAILVIYYSNTSIYIPGLRDHLG